MSSGDFGRTKRRWIFLARADNAQIRYAKNLNVNDLFLNAAQSAESGKVLKQPPSAPVQRRKVR